MNSKLKLLLKAVLVGTAVSLIALTLLVFAIQDEALLLLALTMWFSGLIAGCTYLIIKTCKPSVPNSTENSTDPQ